jgi:hypothetical protein
MIRAANAELEGQGQGQLAHGGRRPRRAHPVVRTSRDAPRRASWKACAVFALVLGVASGSGAAGGTAWAGSTPRSNTGITDPVQGHTYRHGALPLRAVSSGSFGPSATTRVAPAAPRRRGVSGARPLRYGGGPVQITTPHVYLVFWGSQWGTESTSGGYQVFSGDPDGLAPDLEAFFAGLGTDGERWSAIVTQYCQDTTFGAKTCPVAPATDHVAYPSAPVLAGIWEDPSYTPTLGWFPGDNVAGASAARIAQEAAAAAMHFNDASVDAQYFLVSPHLANPDGWLDPKTGYCAYHDNTQDPFFDGQFSPNVAYTNFPYIPDAGTGTCASTGMNDLLDGVTETASHEYAETETDPYPSSGWLDGRGQEVADKCEYQQPGQPGAAIYLTLSTGTFDVQGLWANDVPKRGSCETAHAPVLLANPGKQKSAVGSPVTLSIAALDVRGQPLAFSATGLPAGLVINPASGVISGTPTLRGRSSVLVTASESGGSASVAFTWTVLR